MGDVTLTLGCTARENIVRLKKHYGPLLSYLSSATGTEIRIKVSATYDAMLEAMATGEFDMSIVGPGLWLDAVEAKAPYAVIARPVRHGRNEFMACLVSTRGGEVSRLADLKGHRIAFVSRRSTGGYKLARKELLAAGIDVDHGGTPLFVGSYENVLVAVASGRAAAAACFDGAWRRFQHEGQDLSEAFQVLWRSEPLPNEPFCFSDRMISELPEVAEALVFALETAHETQAGRDALAALPDPVQRFERVDGQAYQRARKSIAPAEAV